MLRPPGGGGGLWWAAMKTTALILLVLLTLGCSPRRGNGGGGGGDGPSDGPGPGPGSRFEADIDGESVPTLSAIYLEEEIPGGGTQHLVMASDGLTCAAYREAWEVLGPAYVEFAVTGDIEVLIEAANEILLDMPGMPGWYGSVNFPDGFEAGDPLEDGVAAGVTEYLDEAPEDPSYGPFAIGAQGGLSEPTGGGIDSLGDYAEGTLAGLAAWYGDYDPNGPNTSQEREATFTFSAAWCDLEDLEVPDP